MSYKCPDDNLILKELHADINNPSLEDAVVVKIHELVYGAYAAFNDSHLSNGAEKPLYFSSSACRDELALFLAFMAAMIYSGCVDTEENKILFKNMLFLKLFRLKDFSSISGYCNSHVSYYYNHAFDEEEHLDINSLIYSLSSLFLLDSKLITLSELDGSEIIFGISETVEAFEAISDGILDRVDSLINFIHSSAKVFKISTFEEDRKRVDRDLLNERNISQNNQKKSTPKAAIAIVSVIAVTGFILLIAILSNFGAEPAEKEVIVSYANLTEYKQPESGLILRGPVYTNESEITIHASSTESCVVKLKTPSGTTRLSFFVRAGDTVTVGVPCETLYVYFASGKTWYGYTDLFGEETSYSMDSNPCDFENYTMEYTLYSVSNGNFQETPIDKSEF